MTLALMGATFFLLGLILGGIVTLLYVRASSSVSPGVVIPRVDVACANVPPEWRMKHG